MKPYIKYLSAEERGAAIRFGALTKLAEHGMLKRADGFTEWPGNILKSIAIASLVAGVPMGALAHVIGRKINASNRQELEAKKKIEFLRNATQQLESGLANA